MYAQATDRSPSALRSEVGLEAGELDPPVSTDKLCVELSTVLSNRRHPTPSASPR
jgi:hypothetical protein